MTSSSRDSSVVEAVALVVGTLGVLPAAAPASASPVLVPIHVHGDPCSDSPPVIGGLD